ncbi:Abscisic acid G-protein coupled receptor [Teratosphaeria destructans]|uniref:Abscisic acid G-protein coupled receptor n=1 Tax=Teratosphaeria destructans TaxID=418781 RepID=A0A9W7W787_9PEZI|nr:Abscisic acid G-protein coupled receptor [Teratosphaeria destructans]
MSLPTRGDECSDCRPHPLQRSLDSVPASTIVFSLTPFLLTWTIAAIVAHLKLFPVLSRDAGAEKSRLPQFNREVFKPSSLKEQMRRPSAQRIASLVFATSIGLSAVLVELLLCEISNTLNSAARGLALRVTLTSLLVLSILLTPALEIHGFAKAVLRAPTESTSTRKAKTRIRIVIQAALFAAWLTAFWYIPQASILRNTLHNGREYHSSNDHVFTEACLERIGIIGISLMASLSGFAAVSSLWQTFGVRYRTIRDSDLQRKEAGLAATEEMLGAKQSRLRALQRKMSETPASPGGAGGFMGRMIGSIRGGGKDAQELQSLTMEVAGLEAMRFTMSSSLSTFRARYTEQQRAKTSAGRCINICNSIFAIYCAYRIIATSLSSLRRWWNPSHSFATSDPINNILALLTTHYDSNLDRAAWSRQISFLLSGVMLLASFNAVLQTFRLFSRFAPSLLRQAHTSLPLVISQIAGTYVISSALLLRSNLPAEVGGVISEALGAPLEGRFVEGWFESWFLVAVGLTATGILVGRKVGGGEDWDDEDGGVGGHEPGMGGDKRH